jgi:hypothetical protein
VTVILAAGLNRPVKSTMRRKLYVIDGFIKLLPPKDILTVSYPRLLPNINGIW